MPSEFQFTLESLYCHSQTENPDSLPGIESALDIGAEEVNPAPVASACADDIKPMEYEDLIYLTGSDSFYLLSQEGKSRCREAEQKLSALVVGVDDKEGKFQGLAKSGLMDALVSADLTSFLEGDEEKKRLSELRLLLAKPDESARRFFDDGKATHGYAWSHYISGIESEYKKLEQKAISAARSKGYRYENGKLYGKRELEIQDEIKRYLKAREAFAGKREVPPQEQLAALKKTTSEFEELVAKTGYSAKGAAEYALANSKEKLAKTEKSLPVLVASIETLALCGIATPEYALNQEGNGHDALAEYYQYLKEAKETEQRIQQKFKQLDSSTNLYAFADNAAQIMPNKLFEDELKQVEVLEKKAARIRETAQKNVLSCQSPMYLLWDTDYKPKPLTRLAKGDFPLREYLSAEPQDRKGKLRQFRYFSLYQLPTTKTLKPGSLSIDENPEQALIRLLGVHIQPLPIEQSWFDDKGLFEPEKLYDALKQKKIAVKMLQSDISGWEENIKEVLFARKLKKRLDPFDRSPQAQFFRMVNTNKTSSDLPGLYKMHVNDFKKVNIASLEASSEISLARGELNLFKAIIGRDYLYFPSEAVAEKMRAELIPLSYIDRDGTLTNTSFNNGALQMRFYAKAWGFVGACLSFNPELALTHEADGVHLTTVGYKSIQEEQVLDIDSINAFLSAEAGIELGCFIDWLLPDDLPELLSRTQQDTQRMVLVRGAIKAEVKKEIKLPIQFSLKHGKPMVTVNIGPGATTVSFEGEISPSALGLWVTQFQRMLRKCKYRKIVSDCSTESFADEESFNFMVGLSRAMLFTQLNVGSLLAYGKDKLDTLISFFDRSERAGMVAHIFNTADQELLRQWVLLLPPEALGPLLDTLVSEPEQLKIPRLKGGTDEYSIVQVHAWQQMAIAKIIHWLYLDAERSGGCYPAKQPAKIQASQRQLEEAVIRMDRNSKAPEEYAMKVWVFTRNERRLLDFMGRDNQPSFNTTDDTYTKLFGEHYKVTKGFYSRLEQILIHMDGVLTEEVKKQITQSHLSYYNAKGKSSLANFNSSYLSTTGK
ncbi:hypothetical protein L3Q72_05595 [Vibrio sp. JC009]|uniref:hypothetical protein n=1 Tax=Vibrio sp. JC009 TaxID=2912314 RepID=UPI0023B1F6BF|nr:hypothetical protein [Vibrio sp. JC009]WED22867.1 hypothetical protein L3Q72_05595 [Vibrio sp. JC009]